VTGRVEGGSTYAAAGVDIEAGERAVELMKEKVAKATRPEVVGDLGGFAGLFALDTAKYRKPLLASSTDGVGTKLAVAQAMDKHDTVGIDLVAMVVDDLVVCGAEPLFLLDYIACGKVVPERMAEIVGGIAEGCRQARCALIGGETAEHPGIMDDDAYDLAATGVGVVEADSVLGSDRVRDGDVVVAMASSGLHSNGFALVRHAILGAARMRLDRYVDELETTLGEVLLTPTRIYARQVLALIEEVEAHAFAHITGGGLAANISRVIPEGLDAEIDRGSWALPELFRFISDRGGVSEAEMERTFNNGVGMVAFVRPEDEDRALAVLQRHGLHAWTAGRVVPGTGTARLVGKHP
jgi:phosphoribosylformylglycinamidine cyclo-ligase